MSGKKVALICENCGKKFERRLAEHKRNQRKGRHVFCSLSCAATWLNKHGKRNPDGNPENLDSGNRRDEYSPFRQHLRMAQRRARNKSLEMEIDLEYLKQLWEEQEARGVYTDWKLDNPQTTKAWEEHERTPRTASLDRIDSSKGYVKGNVQFTSYMANLAKNYFTEEEFIDFCKAVAEHWE